MSNIFYWVKKDLFGCFRIEEIRDKDNETGLKEEGVIEMSIYSAFHIRDCTRSLRLNTYRLVINVHSRQASLTFTPFQQCCKSLAFAIRDNVFVSNVCFLLDIECAPVDVPAIPMTLVDEAEATLVLLLCKPPLAIYLYMKDSLCCFSNSI